jgi:membrane-associated phospholipid phosphatase
VAAGSGIATLDSRVTARFRLPALIRHHRFKLVYVAIWAPYIAAYQLVNRFPLFTPRELPLTSLDRVLPFAPELLPLYVMYIPIYFWTASRIDTDREINRFFYATHLQLLLSLVFFVFLPVRMPRELFYAHATYNWADAFWRWFDAPNNCFPSLHVSNCLLMIQFNWRRSFRSLHTIVLLGVIASTVLVKQHYVVDIAGGAAVYAVSAWFLTRLHIRGVDASGYINRMHGVDARMAAVRR